MVLFILGNGSIALAYFAIPFVIYRFVKQRSDIEFRYLHWLFVAFISFCGVTHLLHIVQLWYPIYYLASWIDVLTGIVSVMTAVILWRLLPLLVALPSIKQLSEINAELKESEHRLRENEMRLRNLGDSLPDSYLYEYGYRNEQLRFHYISGGVEKLHDLKVEDVLDDACLLFRQFDPDYLQRYREAETLSREQMSDFSIDVEFERSGGERRWLHLRARPRRREDGCLVWDGIASDISDRQLFEAEINRLAMAIEQNPVAVLITDRQGNLVYANPAYTRLTGFQFYELYGKNEREFLSTEIDNDAFSKILSGVEAGKPWIGILSNRRKNMTLYWAHCSLSLIYDNDGNILNHLYIKQDVTEREDMIRKLDLDSKVFESSNEAILVSDADNRIVSVNPAFTRITGYSPEAVLGENPRILASGRHNKAFYEAMWRALRQDGAWAGEIWNRRKDGTIYPEWLSIAVVYDRQGNTQNYISIFSNISERKQAEMALLRANADLMRIAEVSAHHLMEPVRRLNIYAQRLRAQLVEQADENSELLTDLDVLERDAKRLRRLVHDIQIYLAAGEISGPVRVEDAEKALAAARQRLSAGANIEQIAFVIEPLPQVMLDRSRLVDLFSVLVDNAVIHGRPSDVNIKPQIVVSGERKNKVSCFRIADNGPGIEPEYRDRVFEIFERLGPFEVHRGSGIGLSIARRIVESRHGKIWIEANEPSGTAVIFELPDDAQTISDG